MSVPVQLRIGTTVVKAELNDGVVAGAVVAALPATLRLTRWGEEYYGSCGVAADLTDDAREVLAVGEIAYWPPGKAICLFFGPTPASTDERPRAASSVVPIGKITDGLSQLKHLGGTIEAVMEVC